MIDNSFENDYPRTLDSLAGAIEQLSHPGQHRSLHRRQRTSVHMEPGDALKNASITNEDWCSLLFNDGERVRHPFQPSVLH